MAAKLNQHEKFARYSVMLAVVGGLAALAAVYGVFSAFRPQNFEVIYSPRSLRFPAILGSIFIAGAAGTAGFFLALSSAGQKRNKLVRMSWLGFFLNAGIVTVALCVFVFFWLAKESVGK